MRGHVVLVSMFATIKRLSHTARTTMQAWQVMLGLWAVSATGTATGDLFGTDKMRNSAEDTAHRCGSVASGDLTMAWSIVCTTTIAHLLLAAPTAAFLLLLLENSTWLHMRQSQLLAATAAAVLQ